ncbi:MAG: hypothetical protein JRE47_14215, partial [Deltaproteobacteria bacterium]|nr:hypothetical protein [Deltaproteobacteria bacterium]
MQKAVKKTTRKAHATGQAIRLRRIVKVSLAGGKIMEGVDTVKGILNKIYGIKKGALAFKKILPLIEKFP